MKKALFLLVLCLSIAQTLWAQEAGNRIYSNKGYYSNQNRKPFLGNGSLAGPRQFEYSIEAAVLYPMKADAYVAVFGIERDGKTAEGSNRGVDAAVDALKRKFAGLGISGDDVFVDFIAQTPVFKFETKNGGKSIVEVPAGFSTKKTVAFRYKDRALIDKLVALAAEEAVFDLIKVDYVVADFESVRERLFEEATEVLLAKKARYEKRLGIELFTLSLANENYDAVYPFESYQKYKAFETGNYDIGDSDAAVTLQRKSETFYYEPLDSAKFDRVLAKPELGPMVQFTLYLRLNCLRGSVPPAAMNQGIPPGQGQ
ncbi:MAG: SIMPL domain-containing protein [Pyrinomonadaceae bacterium]